MKTDKSIFIAFLLNLFFSIVEFFGGIVTGSIAITSDAFHDFGDAITIGISFLFEKKSKKQPNKKYTYGYARFSILGGLITSCILLCGCCIVMHKAIYRIILPTPLEYNSVIIISVFGFVVNLLATYFTNGSNSINQKAINLHLLEDVLGWIVILVGAIIMRFTNLYILDPILSIAIALFILYNSIKALKEIFDLFLIKTPKNIDLEKLKAHLLKVDGVLDVHHVHLWSIDGNNVYSTLHVVCEKYDPQIKQDVKNELLKHNITHSTVEIETNAEQCLEQTCITYTQNNHCLHSHHH